MSKRNRDNSPTRYSEGPIPKLASIPKSNCKTESGIVSMEDCIKDFIENKTNYFIIIYRDSTGEYGNVLKLKDLKIFLQTHNIQAYINLWKGDGYIPFYFTTQIIRYINRPDTPNILIVEKKRSLLSWAGRPDYFDIHFADHVNGHVIPRIHINYTEDDEKRGKERYEFVPEETKMAEPPRTPGHILRKLRDINSDFPEFSHPKQTPNIPFSYDLDVGDGEIWLTRPFWTDKDWHKASSPDPLVREKAGYIDLTDKTKEEQQVYLARLFQQGIRWQYEPIKEAFSRD